MVKNNMASKMYKLFENQKSCLYFTNHMNTESLKIIRSSNDPHCMNNVWLDVQIAIAKYLNLNIQ